MPLLNLLIIFILIIFTAFFVACEFAIVKVRKTRIDYLASTGNQKAVSAKKIIENVDDYLSATQLGITITALGLGWLGEPTIEKLLRPLIERFSFSGNLTQTISITLAFVIITYINVVLGELSPKTFSIQKAEQVSLFIAKPLIVFNRVMYPFIFVLNRSASLFTRMFGLKSASESEMVHTEEELRLILSESLEGGEINPSEYRYVNRIFEFDDRVAKEIMVPRTEVVCLYKEKSFQENLEIMRGEKFTRYPVAAQDKDHIIGIVNIKEFFNEAVDQKDGELEEYIRPIITAYESAPIQKLLVKMQKERTHMAVLVDEYGGTAGIVTVEDILEEIVGEIRDEFDEDEEPEIQKISPTNVIVDGKVLISEVNEMLNIDIDEDEIDTIGGWILTQTIDRESGNAVDYQGYRFIIVDLDGHQVKKIEIIKLKEEPVLEKMGTEK